MADVFEQRIQDVITEIVQFAPQLQGLALELRAKIANLEAERATDELKLDENYWTIVCYADALIRMRLIVEQNFRFVETLGLLAVTRFLFETVVWLRVLRRDRRFGLTYRFQIIEKQLSYYRDFRKKLESEIDMLISLGEEEGDKVTALALAAINESPSESSHIGEELKAIEMEIDRKARRNFCLYAESAKTNGHGFQAELIKTKVLPDIIVRIETLEKERSEFLAHITGRPPTSTSWEKQSRDWKWKAQAGRYAWAV
jgi:hypothetical protein